MASTGAEAGFGDDREAQVFPAAPKSTPALARTWVDIAASDGFLRVGQAIGEQRTLNRMQKVALGLVCEALDTVTDETAGPDNQHLQYIGGGGGTGKSWLIAAIKDVFAAKGASNQIVITATSGTAAAGIGGNTIHSAVGLAFKDQDGAAMENIPPATMERSKQRWRRRKVLVLDEVSMLGLKTLYELDQKLRMLRGFQDRPFGGLPVVIFTGDFLQFGPVQQKGLLSDVEGVTGAQAKANPSDRATQSRWQQTQAKRVWQEFTSVVMLEEQKRAQGDAYLLGFLERFRSGQQTAADAKNLQARYDPASKLDFSNGRRAIIPLNRHRWDLTLYAALAFGAEKSRKVSLYLSAHHCKSRTPSEEEMEAVMLLGDDAQLQIPGIFPYVEGMPVVVTQNKYLGLKVVNGAEFVAAGIIHPTGIEEHVVNDKLSIFFGPPSGILLSSEATQGMAFPHLPPDTIMLAAETVALQDRHRKSVCPGSLGRVGFKIGVSRTGLPCVPGIALTDYKSQGRNIPKTLLGLYGRRPSKYGQELEKCDVISMYVQLSRCHRFEDINLIQPLKAEHFLEARMPEEMVKGVDRLKALARKTVEGFKARHGKQG